nr:hypothetical protein [Tanacetum cinerariifolium]
MVRKLGLIMPLSDSSFSYSDKSFILEGASRYGARATGAAPEVFSVATKSELNVARFVEMYVANTSVEARWLALEVELATLRDKSHQENQGELIKHFSKLEVDHLNLQLKYQNLKDVIGNNPTTPDKDTPDFDSVFVIGKMQASLQGKDNAICQLKKQLSKLQLTSNDTERIVKVRTTDSQLTNVTDPVTNLQAQNDLFRAENDKVKQHYKQLYDSIKITRAKHIEQVTKLTTENVTQTDFASWQQRIRLYCRGKDNGVNILKSIDEGPYKLVTFRETLAESTEGTPQFGLERPRVYSDMNYEEKDWYNVDIRATNILLQGLPKDIYTHINHYTDAKDIWNNVKMLLDGSELTKEDRESQLYYDFEHFKQHKEESIHDYYVRGLRDSNYDKLFAYLKQHEAHAKENKMMLERLSQPTTQPTADPLALLSNVSNTQHGLPSSSTSSFTQLPPPRTNSSSPADDLIENLTSTLALLTQSYKTFLPQTNNQL